MELYEAPLPELQAASSFVRKNLNGDRIWYNRNFHLEPSNICAHRCKFCSYRRDNASQPGAWSMALDEVILMTDAATDDDGFLRARQMLAGSLDGGWEPRSSRIRAALSDLASKSKGSDRS